MTDNALLHAVQREQIARLTTTASALKAALRRLAIKGHMRAGPRGGSLPSGHSCAVCKSEWPPGWPERHSASCLLANDGGG